MKVKLKIGENAKFSFQTGKTEKKESGNLPKDVFFPIETLPSVIADMGIIPFNQWNYWQETNDDAKATTSLTVKPTGKCLLVAAVMHRDKNISIEGEGWTKVATSPTIQSETTRQYVTVWTKSVAKGTYEITVNQETEVRMSFKAICLYGAKKLNVIDNKLIPSFPILPTAKASSVRRLYLLSSIYTLNDAITITVNSGNLYDLRKAEEKRFIALYDYETDNLSIPTFSTTISDYKADTSELITLEIEEE